jgi:hypothetical protein
MGTAMNQATAEQTVLRLVAAGKTAYAYESMSGWNVMYANDGETYRVYNEQVTEEEL